MPAKGERGAINPNVIKAASKRPAPKARNLPQAKPRFAPSKPPTSPAKGVRGSSAPPVRGAVNASPTKGQEPRTRFSYLMGKPHGTELPGVKQAEVEKGRAERQKALAKQHPHPVNWLAVAPNLLSAIEAKGYQNIASIIPGKTGKAITRAIGKGAGEITQLAASPIVGIAKGSEALSYGAKGNWRPGEEFAKGLTEGAVGQALQGRPGKALHIAGHQPILSAAEVAGGEAILGRAGGATLRAAGSTAEAGGLRGAAARAGSYVRPPIAATDEAAAARKGYVKQREYSKDVFRKGAQVLADKRRKPIVGPEQAPFGPAKAGEYPKPQKPVTIRERGREMPVLKGFAREQSRIQRHIANYESGMRQAVENIEREGARRQVAQIEGPRSRLRTWLAPQRAGEAITRLTAGGVIKHLESAHEDVARYVEQVRQELKNPGNYRNKNELTQAKHHAEMLEKLLRNPHFHWDAAVARGIQYGRALREGDVRLGDTNVFEPHELEHGAMSEYALSHMKVKWDHTKDTLVHPNGDPVTVDEIRAHAIREGRAPDTLGYVPHAVKEGRPQAYHRPLKIGTRPTAPGLSRKGIILRRGGMQMDKEILQDELTKKRVTANAAEGIDKVVKMAGLKRPDGKYFTPRGAVETADKLTHDTGVPYVAIRGLPAKNSVEIQRQIKDAQDPVAMETAHRALLNDRVIDKPNAADQTANVVVMPADHVNTLLKHLSSPGDMERFVQMLNGPFRMAVLPQPRWLTGNFVEPYLIRLPLSGAGINIPGSAVDLAASTKLLKGMEDSGSPEVVRAAAEIRAMQKGGMFIGRRGASYHRTWKQFSGRTAESLYAAHYVRNLNVFRQSADLVLMIPHSFFQVNRAIESTAQGIALGKAVRNDVQAITGSWLKTIKLNQEAMAEVQRGLVNTPTQLRFMEKQYEMLGQYAGFNPATRRLVQSAFPFIPWTLNSLRFAYWTLPAHHTAAFAALARLSNSLLAEWQAEHKSLPPGELQYAVKRKDEGLVNVGRYTPLAAAVNIQQGDFGAFTSQAFPQAQGSMEALEGRTPFGQELKTPKTKANPKGKATTGDKLAIAVNNFLESIIPGMAMGRRLQERGGTGYSTSTVFSPQTKPGTRHQGAVNRTFNPLAPTYLKSPKKKKRVDEGAFVGEGATAGAGEYVK